MKKISTLIISLIIILLDSTALAEMSTRQITLEPLNISFVERPEDNTIYNLGLISFIEDEELEMQDWWLLYADENLNSLIDKVIKNNLDQKIALNKLEASYFQVQASHGREFPNISIGTQYNGQKNPENLTAFPLSRLNNSGPRIFAPGQWVNIYSLPINLSYEPDFFLKNHLKTKSKRIQAEATHYEVELNKLNITYKAAELYFNLTNLEKQIELQSKILELTEKNALLTKDLANNGLSNKISLNIINENIKNQEIEYRTLINMKDILLSDLAFLMGEKPYIKDISSDLESIQEPKLNPSDLSSELLYNRPDIKISEKLLAASDVDIQVARKAYLPSFSLALQNSLSSVNISNLVSPESLLVAVIAGMTQTLFTAGAREAELNYTKAKNKELFNSHSKTILNALKEAELELKNLDKSQNILTLTQEKEKLINERLVLSLDKNKQGIISELDLNLIKIASLEAEASRLNAKTGKLISFSMFSKILGGKVNAAS
jgi:outer membrane protein, multidrug efflux system